MCYKKINNVDLSNEDLKIYRSKKLVKKSSSSLKQNLKDYYKHSPERRHRVLIVNRKNFFNDSQSESISEKK